MAKKLSEKKMDAIIERLYRQACPNVEIDIMDISKIFAVGRKALSEGKSEDEVKAAIVEFVNTIRKN